MQIILLLSWRQTSNEIVCDCIEKNRICLFHTLVSHVIVVSVHALVKQKIYVGRLMSHTEYQKFYFFYANYFNANRVHTSMWATCHGILLPIEFIYLSNEHLKHDILTFHRISYQWHSMSLVFLFLSTILSASEPSAGLSNCSYIWLWFLFTIRLNDTYFIIKRWMCAMQSKSFIYNYVGSSDGFFSFKMRWLWKAAMFVFGFRIEKLKDIDILALRISSLCTDSI